MLTILDEDNCGVAMLAPATSVYWRHSQTGRDLSDWECLGKQGCCRDTFRWWGCNIQSIKSTTKQQDKNKGDTDGFRWIKRHIGNVWENKDVAEMQRCHLLLHLQCDDDSGDDCDDIDDFDASAWAQTGSKLWGDPSKRLRCQSVVMLVYPLSGHVVIL